MIGHYNLTDESGQCRLQKVWTPCCEKNLVFFYWRQTRTCITPKIPLMASCIHVPEDTECLMTLVAMHNDAHVAFIFGTQ